MSCRLAFGRQLGHLFDRMPPILDGLRRTYSRMQTLTLPLLQRQYAGQGRIELLRSFMHSRGVTISVLLPALALICLARLASLESPCSKAS